MSPKRILVVDDERDIVEIVSEFLRGEGYQVFQAYDGQQALEALERHRLDAVVLDIKMPVLDGLEVIRRVRQNPAFRKIPIVVLTATRVIQELQQEFQQLQVHSWLAKPFEPDQLIASVKTALGDR